MVEYKFYFIVSSVETECFPLSYDKVKFQYVRSENDFYFEKKLVGDLIFSNRIGYGITDYTFLKDILDNDECDRLGFKIVRSCDQFDTDMVFWTGYFNIKSGEWDFDKCTMSVTPLYDGGNYKCLASGKQVNVIGAGSPVTVLYEAGSNPDRNYTGVLFSQVASYIVTQTCSDFTGIISDLFQINPENISEAEYVSGSGNVFTQMVLIPVTNLAQPTPSDLATIANVSFLELINDLQVFFNVGYEIIGDQVRIEHQSFFLNGTIWIDFTTPDYEQYLSGTRKYKYFQVPQEEILVLGDNDYDPKTSDYGMVFLYPKNCSDSSSVSKKTVKFGADAFAYYNGENINRKEFMIMYSCEYNSGLGKYVVIGSFNDNLRLRYLCELFQRHGRFLTECYRLNYSTPWITFTSKPVKSRTPIKVPFCCDMDFDVNSKIKTEDGDAFIGSVEMSPRSNTIAITPLYIQEESHPDITPDDLPNLEIWLKADSGITLSGSNVTSWADQSGNGNDAIQSTAAWRPTVATAIKYLQKESILFDGVNDRLMTPPLTLYSGGVGEIIILFKIIGTTYATANHVIYRLSPPFDGTEVISEFSNMMRIGIDDGGIFFPGDITEIIGYTTPLTNDQYNQIYLYLQKKYALFIADL